MILQIIFYFLAGLFVLFVALAVGFSAGYDAGRFDAEFERDLNIILGEKEETQ